MMTYRTEKKVYAEPELDILACILYDPKLIDELVISEDDFEHYGYVLSFFKKVYEKYHTLDTDIMFSVVKNTSLLKIMDVLELLTDILPVPSNFKAYQKRVLERNIEDRELKNIKEHIIDIGQDFALSNTSVDEYMERINRWYEYYKNNIKSKLDDFEVFTSEVEELHEEKETV